MYYSGDVEAKPFTPHNNQSPVFKLTLSFRHIILRIYIKAVLILFPFISFNQGKRVPDK